MPLLQLKEIWTPLSLLGFKFYKGHDRVFIKFFNSKLKKLG
ncbi:hypothetical protein [Bacillus sp. HMF5848]|nr:hypothetical protein [Bacillus sp. HMF5848]